MTRIFYQFKDVQDFICSVHKTHEMDLQRWNVQNLKKLKKKP